MANFFQELLRVTKWTPQANDEVGFPADFTTSYSPPAGGPRFVRIQAHDGDLVYSIVLASASAPTYGTGHRRVTSGDYDVAQIGPDQKLYVGAVSGTVHGAVIWGQ